MDNTSRNCWRNLKWKTATRFYYHNIGMRCSYLLKSNFKWNLQKHHFVPMLVCEVIIKWYLNFITCLYFPLVLIEWNSSHCHLMELCEDQRTFQGRFKENVDSNNNWKTAWTRMILEWHLFVRLNHYNLYENVEFCGKSSKFLP